MSRTSRIGWWLLVATVAALWSGGYELGFLFDAERRAVAGDRLVRFLMAFGSPDLTGEFVRRAIGLAVDTVAMAVLGTLVGVVLGGLLGIAGSRAFMVNESRSGATRRLLVGLTATVRLVQAVLRGVPDFAWAILLIPLLDIGPVVGWCAIAISSAGIIGRVYSEALDAAEGRVLEPLRGSGAGRLALLGYGLLPAARGPMLSFALLRWECNARNAAVIGAVGGGGLGSELLVRLDYGEYGKVLTLVVLLLLITTGSDLVSRFMRGATRRDAGSPQSRAIAGAAGFHAHLARAGQRKFALQAVVLLLLAGWSWLRLGGFAGAPAVAGGVDFSGLLTPDLRLLPHAAASAAVPLSMAFLGTALAVLVALVGAYAGSWLLQVRREVFGDRPSRVARTVRAFGALAWRAAGIVLRGVPEVLWALAIVSFTLHGSLAGMLALALHSTGILLRLYIEALDRVPAGRLEVVHAASGSAAKTFLYGALPSVRADWTANAFFQFEANVRTGLILGMVGVGGLGFYFDYEFGMFHMTRASPYLLVMIALSLGLASLSRRLGLGRRGV